MTLADDGTGTASGGYTEGDTLRGIEHIYGSHHDDALTGNPGRNYLTGRDGDDRLYGGDDDTLRGWHGNDRLDGGDGDDTFVFGVEHGNDTIKTSATRTPST